MDRFIDVIVRRSIRHARLMLRQGAYDWPTVRKALRKILADLESRSPNHPGLPRPSHFYRLERSRMVARKSGACSECSSRRMLTRDALALVQVA
jgi:hypothetical protein